MSEHLGKLLDRGLLNESGVWRRHLHMWPELLFDLEDTASWVSERLQELGVDAIYRDFAPGSVVAVIDGREGDGPSLAIRADMDALPVTECDGRAHGSRRPGRMHACGHDGHTAILLTAARVLSASRRFRGRCVLVFQPAEEGGAGARRMIEGGLFTTDRFQIDEIYGLHNLPGLTLGHVGFRQGATMAASDRFEIVLDGGGGHAAQPHLGVDVVVAGAALVWQLQRIVARTLDPVHPAVVTVSAFEASSSHNLMAPRAVLRGSARSFDAETRNRIEERMTVICKAAAAESGATITLDYRRGYDPVVNGAVGYTRISRVARAVLPVEAIHSEIAPLMVAEDFSDYLKHKPGGFLFLGNGDTAPLHSNRYDFDDRAIATGAGFWISLIEEVRI